MDDASQVRSAEAELTGSVTWLGTKRPPELVVDSWIALADTQG
jgi:hypothetical protein